LKSTAHIGKRIIINQIFPVRKFKINTKRSNDSVISTSESELWNPDDNQQNWILTAGKIQNKRIAAKKINGIQCTLTAWVDRESMLHFMRSGIHLKAMKSFHKIATGSTHGYESETKPSWDEAFSILTEKGKKYT
jgi:hypothetical protein